MTDNEADTPAVPATTTTAPEPHKTPGTDEELPRPRVRAGALVWGVVLIIAGTIALAVLTSRQRRDDVLAWLTSLDGATVALLAVLAVGMLLLAIAGLALVRRHQVRRGLAA